MDHNPILNHYNTVYRRSPYLSKPSVLAISSQDVEVHHSTLGVDVIEASITVDHCQRVAVSMVEIFQLMVEIPCNRKCVIGYHCDPTCNKPQFQNQTSVTCCHMIINKI